MPFLETEPGAVLLTFFTPWRRNSGIPLPGAGALAMTMGGVQLFLK